MELHHHQCAFTIGMKGSMKNKTVSICDLILQNDIDILIVTESWLNGNHYDDPTLGDIRNTLPNYQMSHLARPTLWRWRFCYFCKGFQVKK